MIVKCECCGKEFISKTKQKYCSLNCKEWMMHGKKKEKPKELKAEPKQVKSFSEINHEAKELGMSYGKYVAMKKI